MTWIVVWLSRWSQRLAWALATLLLVTSASWATYDYFVRFPRAAPDYYHLYAVDKLDALNYLAATYPQDTPDSYQIYLSRLWAEHATVRFLRGQLGIKSLDTSETLVLPAPGRGAAYAFPIEQESRARRLAELWPQATVQIVNDRYGNSIMAVTDIPAIAAALWPSALQPLMETEIRFSEAPTLLGVASEPASGEVTLFWRAEEEMLRDLTSFIHLVDVDGRQVGQIDRAPGAGGYSTPKWSPGERVIDRYTLNITELCAGGEQVRTRIGWYELAAGALNRPRADGAGNTASGGELVMPFRAYPLDTLLAERESLDLLYQPLPDGLGLVGFHVRETPLQPGAPVRVDLFWQGGERQSNRPIQLWLTGDANNSLLWEGAIAPGADWNGDDVLCRRIRARLPMQTEIGSHTLEVRIAPLGGSAGGESVLTLAEIAVEPSTRNFEVPTHFASSTAILGDQIGLAGFLPVSQAQAGVPLEVQLAWQALVAPQGNYKAFVHLLDENGQLVAQSDLLPGGTTTSQWMTGEFVLDTHRLEVPSDLPPGRYRLVAGLYDSVDGVRLPVSGIGFTDLCCDLASLAEIEVQANGQR
ncbi:MAG: hypothetical protein HC802_13525 [Caldilineaceae bacterium]|nr:hypothetical protein [Caldilineaceae bacterium]